MPGTCSLITWINHYPELAQSLRFSYRAYASARHSGVSFSQQKATERVDAFPKFHGLRPDGQLMRAWVARPGEVRQHSRFSVQVDIRIPRRKDRPVATGPSWLLPAHVESEPAVDPLWPDREAIKLTADALQWVLQQLLDYPDVLEIAPKKDD